MRQQGLEVVFADRLPRDAFTASTWARVAKPRGVRFLATEPFPPGAVLRAPLADHGLYAVES